MRLVNGIAHILLRHLTHSAFGVWNQTTCLYWRPMGTTATPHCVSRNLYMYATATNLPWTCRNEAGYKPKGIAASSSTKNSYSHKHLDDRHGREHTLNIWKREPPSPSSDRVSTPTYWATITNLLTLYSYYSGFWIPKSIFSTIVKRIRSKPTFGYYDIMILFIYFFWVCGLSW